jgi:hypothetical protein
LPLDTPKRFRPPAVVAKNDAPSGASGTAGRVFVEFVRQSKNMRSGSSAADWPAMRAMSNSDCVWSSARSSLCHGTRRPQLCTGTVNWTEVIASVGIASPRRQNAKCGAALKYANSCCLFHAEMPRSISSASRLSCWRFWTVR